jgi:predicted transposase YdaD
MAHGYDATVKDLVWAGAPALLGILAGAPVACFLSAEFSSVRQRRPDMVARLADGGLFHLELQTGADARMDWRMLEYYAPISEQNGGEPVTQLVLHLGERKGGKPAGIGHPNLQFSYDVRYIADLDAKPLLDSPLLEDAVLAILCRSDDIRERVRHILARLVPLGRRERADAAAKLLILAQLRRAVPIVKQEVETMAVQFKLSEHPYLSEIIAKELAEGMAEAKAEGMAEGRAEAKAEGRAEALLRVIERRHGSAPESLAQRVRAASVDDLDRWLDAVIDAPSLGASELDAILSPSRH